jgi:hypothetical protein
LQLQTSEKYRYNVCFFVKFPNNLHGALKYSIEVQDKDSIISRRYNMDSKIISGIRDIITIDNSLLLLKFYNKKKGL